VTLTEPAAKFAVFGVISKVKAAAGTTVRGTFADGGPAVVANKAGEGATLYCAFLPSLSAFLPATPLKPLDRGSTDDAMAHFIPTTFDGTVTALLGGVGAHTVRPVVSETSLVETSVIESPKGTVIVVSNWSGQPVAGLKLTVNIPVPSRKVELASGGKIQVEKGGGKLRLTFDLDVADTVILR
jgi:hypothetical protein